MTELEAVNAPGIGEGSVTEFPAGIPMSPNREQKEGKAQNETDGERPRVGRVEMQIHKEVFNLVENSEVSNALNGTKGRLGKRPLEQ